MQDRVETLESQLAEKEQLVAALTERLEQAAEQLDRLHRTGADRTLHAGIAGIPPQLIEQQQKLVDELQRAVQQWEDMQPGALFGRLEAQVSQIREMVQNLDSAPGDHASPGGSGLRAALDRATGSESRSSQAPRRSPSSSPQSILEMMKSSLLATPDADPQDKEPTPQTDAAFSAAAQPAVFHVDLPPLDDAPSAIDGTQASQAELVEACEARDKYIVYLLQRLRQIESLGHVPNSWAEVENVPAELRGRLESLEKRLQETLRLAEVELSLQRAKLAREEVRVRIMDEQMQKELKRIRDSAAFEGEKGEKGDEQGSGGRWRRMLGRRENG